MQNRPGSDLDGLVRVWPNTSGLDGLVRVWPNTSGLDGLVRVWPNTSGLEASRYTGISRTGFWQDATGRLPVSHFQTRFRSSTDVPGNIVQNQPGSDLVLADCVRFWPNGSGPEASRCAMIMRPASNQCCPAGRDRMRIGSSMIIGEKSSKQLITLAHSLPGNEWK